MLVRCPCGKKLKVKDSLAGKKVRCPSCEEIFRAESDEDEEGIIAEKPSKKRPEEEEDEEEEQERDARRRKKSRAVRDEDDDEEDDEETQSSRKKRKGGAPGKKGVPLWRQLVAGGVLLILLVVAGIIFYRKLSKPGTVRVALNIPADVFLDGKKQSELADSVALEFQLSAGPHEIKVSRDEFESFTKQIEVKSGEIEEILVRLKPIKGSDVKRPVDPATGKK